MLIFGIHTAQKHFGSEGMFRCGHCNNEGLWQLVENTLWFSLFFIRLIPLKRNYLSVCPVCGFSVEKTKKEFKELMADRNDA